MHLSAGEAIEAAESRRASALSKKDRRSCPRFDALVSEIRRNYRKLSWEEEVNLLEKSRQGNKGARDTLFFSCAPFALRIAMGFCGGNRGPMAREYESLVSAAFTGLLEGIDKLDPHRGRLTTAAFWHIRKACLNYVYENRIIRAPKGIQCGRAKVPADEIPRAECAGTSSSLLERSSHREPADDLFEKELIENIGKLPAKWSAVLLARFRDGKTLEQTSREIGVSKQRISQIQKRALAELRGRYLREDTRKPK